MKKILLPLAAMFIFFSFTLSAAEGHAQDTSPQDKAQPFPITKYEDTISNSKSIGIQSGYGFKAWDDDHILLNTVILQPYFTLPVTDVILEDTFLRGILEYKLEVPLGLITTLHDRSLAGLSPLSFRYDFTGFKDRFVPYASGSLGMTYLDVPSRVQGTKYDFILAGALGTQYFITDKWTISAECRYFHLSNAGIKEPNRGQNYIFGLVGIGRYFR
ncbi:MAG: acyloxyacyl hydrolase [Nitrospirota bacterium]